MKRVNRSSRPSDVLSAVADLLNNHTSEGQTFSVGAVDGTEYDPLVTALVTVTSAGQPDEYHLIAVTEVTP